jgi:hypothetical protein
MRTRRARHPQHQLAGLTIPVAGYLELDQDLLDSQRSGARGERPDDLVELGQRRVHDRPDVELDAVPVQPGQLAVAGTGGAQAVQAGVQDALDLRQAAYAPPVLVARDRQVADVSQDDEPLIVGNLAALHAEQVHVRGRGQPGQLEP